MGIRFPEEVCFERRKPRAPTVFGVKARKYLKAVPFSSVPGGTTNEKPGEGGWMKEKTFGELMPSTDSSICCRDETHSRLLPEVENDAPKPTL
jgi:hypothetical protein